MAGSHNFCECSRNWQRLGTLGIRSLRSVGTRGREKCKALGSAKDAKSAKKTRRAGVTRDSPRDGHDGMDGKGHATERTIVVSGTSVSVRVDFGRSRLLTHTKIITPPYYE